MRDLLFFSMTQSWIIWSQFENLRFLPIYINMKIETWIVLKFSILTSNNFRIVCFAKKKITTLFESSDIWLFSQFKYPVLQLEIYLRMYAALKNQFYSKKNKKRKKKILCNFLVRTLVFPKNFSFFPRKPQKLLRMGPQLFLCTCPAGQTAQKQKSCTTKSPLMHDYWLDI